MKHPLVNLCQYPSKIIWIDDDAKYLKLTATALKKDYYIESYHNPVHALEALNSPEYQQNNFLKCMTDFVEEEADHLQQNYNLRELHEQLYNKDRFEEVSVFIIDYAMPSMNGIAFINKLDKKFQHCRFILLTGEASINQAVDAFNNGDIDFYINKGTAGLDIEIRKIIDVQQQQYFANLSNLILSNESDDCINLNEMLNNHSVAERFHETCEKNNIIEYYILNDMGDFILLNRHGDISLLLLRSNKSIHGYHETARYAEADEKITTMLANNEFIPFFYSDDDLEVEPDDWQEYMHAAKPVSQPTDNGTLYCCAFLQVAPDIYQIDRDILSYDKFLELRYQ